MRYPFSFLAMALIAAAAWLFVSVTDGAQAQDRVLPRAPARPVTIAAPLPVPIAGTVELAPSSSLTVMNSPSAPLYVQEVNDGDDGDDGSTDCEPKCILPPTGRTIAGPAYYRAPTTATVQVWRNNADTIKACATVVNTGSQDILFSAGGVLPITVSPGITRARCDDINTTSFYGLQCSGPGCEAVWRVDVAP